MISQDFIASEVEWSRSNRRTSAFLRRLTFIIVADALDASYASEAPQSCLQGTLAIQQTLSDFGIRSKTWAGSVCFPSAFDPRSGNFEWGGFWDQDHHTWVQTEWDEFVDYTISLCHLHQRARGTHALSVPAVWGQPEDIPPCLIYLPEDTFTAGLTGEHGARLQDFLQQCRVVKDEYTRTKSISRIKFGPILENRKVFEDLVRQGHKWCEVAAITISHEFPIPEWIETRIRALEARSRGERIADHGAGGAFMEREHP